MKRVLFIAAASLLMAVIGMSPSAWRMVGSPAKGGRGGLRDSGAAYIFESSAGGNDGWRHVQKIEASDSAATDRFGYAVALS
jgi:FG-GAP repeat